MIRKLLLGLVGVFVLAAAASTVVVAAAYALFVVLRDQVGAAGAAGLVALAFAVLIGLVSLVAGMKGPLRRKPEPGVVEKLTQMAKERPILAAGAALAAGLIALRNPQTVVSIVSAVMATRAADKTDRRRR